MSYVNDIHVRVGIDENETKHEALVAYKNRHRDNLHRTVDYVVLSLLYVKFLVLVGSALFTVTSTVLSLLRPNKAGMTSR